MLIERILPSRDVDEAKTWMAAHRQRIGWISLTTMVLVGRAAKARARRDGPKFQVRLAEDIEPIGRRVAFIVRSLEEAGKGARWSEVSRAMNWRGWQQRMALEQLLAAGWITMSSNYGYDGYVRPGRKASS